MMANSNAVYYAEIEKLRKKLNELVLTKGINNKEVLAISRKLDELIVEFNKKRT